MIFALCTLLAAPAFTSPMQMRPVVAKTNARVESTFAADSPGGLTNTTMLSAAYAPTPQWAVGARYGVLISADQWLVTNPSVNGTFLLPLGDNAKLGFMVGAAFPAGTTNNVTLSPRGNAVRSYMENATFGINDYSPVAGVDAAWAANGFTAQAEFTAIFGIARAGAPAGADPSKINSATGLFVGYTFDVPLSLGVEAHYQRYLTNHASVIANPKLRDSVSLAAGARYTFDLGAVTLRPGFIYSALLYAPTAPVNHMCTLELTALLK